MTQSGSETKTTGRGWAGGLGSHRGHRRLAALGLVGAMLGAVAAPASAQDWPGWRGDRLRSGRATGTAQMTAPAVRWSYYLGGRLGGLGVLPVDVDGDGQREIVMAPGGKVVVKDGQDRIEWDSVPLQITALETLADLDGDGVPELVARSGQRAFVIDGQDGTVRWSYQYGSSLVSLTAYDVNGDGVHDLILEGYTGVSCNREIRWFDFASGGYGAPTDTLVFAVNLCNSLPFVIGDLDGNGDPELMVDTRGTYHVMNPLTGATKASTTLFSGYTYNTVWLADVDGDGTTTEVVHLSTRGFHQRVLALRWNGSSLSPLFAPREIATNNAQTDVRNTRFFADSVVDLDGDGHMEIVFSTFNQLPEGDGRWRLLVMDATTGVDRVVVMDRQLEGLVDLDGDGTLEVLAMDASGAAITGVDFGDLEAYAFHTTPSASLTLRWSLPGAAVHRVVRRQGPTMAHAAYATAYQDLDGDGVDEVYVDREETGDSFPEALQAIGEVGGQPHVVAEYRPTQTATRATIVGLGGDLTGAGRPAETLVSLSNGFLVGLDPLMATSAVLRTGGYKTFKVIAFDRLGTGQLDLGVVDSRNLFHVLDPSQADLTEPPQRVWSFASATRFYPQSHDYDHDGSAELVVTDWDGTGKVVSMLEADGAVKWSVHLGVGRQSMDTIFTPAEVTGGGNVDVYASIYNNTTATRNLIALNGDDGSEVFRTSARMGNNYLEPLAIRDVNGDGREDAVYSSGSGQYSVYSGLDGAVLHSASIGYERHVALMDCDGDAALEVVAGTGPAVLRMMEVDGTTRWTYPAPLNYVFDGRDPAPVDADGAGGLDLAFGDKFGQLRVVAGQSGALLYSEWLHRGQVLSADPGEGLPVGSGVGGDIDGDGQDEILIPSSDGFLYCLNAEDGSLAWAYDFRYPVAEPILADLDGDGVLEVIVSVDDGYLYALQGASLPPLVEVRDVALNPAAQITDPATDVDAQEHTGAAAAAWDPVAGAAGYRVALVSETGSVVVPWIEVTGATQVVLTGLQLQSGHGYRFLVMAFGAGGASSVQTQSDGFTVTDVSPPEIHDLRAEPAAFSPNGDGLQESLNLLARLTDFTALAHVEVSITNAGAATVQQFGYAISGTEYYLVQGWDGRDATGLVVSDGSYTLTVTATDAHGLSTSDATSVWVDTVAPMAPDIVSPSAGERVGDPRPLVSGTAEASAWVTVTVDDQYACVGSADGTGAWSCVVGSDLADGPHTVSAMAEDAAGNRSPDSPPFVFLVDTAAPTPPTILEPVSGAQGVGATPDVAGRAEVDARVRVFEGAAPLCEATSDTGGQWTCVSAALGPGTHTLFATATDPAGNESDPSDEVTFEVLSEPGSDAGVEGDGSIEPVADGGDATQIRGEGGGCSCEAGGAGTGLPLLPLLGLVALLGWRRRRARLEAAPRARGPAARRARGPAAPRARVVGIALPALVLAGLLALGPGACGPTSGPSNNNNAAADADGDCIPDEVEGGAAVDTDGDGTPDFQDTDADGDGLSDQEEAGDCGAPVDTDGDGAPDFQDTDSDGNGVADGQEPGGDLDGDGTPDRIDSDDDGDGFLDVMEIGSDSASPLDTDGDGAPDFRDTDSDGDTILDRHEGLLDSDQNAPDPAERDGVPDMRDLDSDGDGISDADEAGDADPETRPVDTDGDGLPDFRDYDSDGDGLPDYTEQVLGTDRTARDTDGDGVSDLVEVAAGTDPIDPQSTLPAGDFYFELPFEDPAGPKTAVLSFTTDVKAMDVVINVDTTASMGGEIQNLRLSLSQTISDIRAEVPDTSFGVSRFEDFPLAPYGDEAAGDQPFTLLQQVTRSATRVQAAVDALSVRDGGDLPEASLEALYQLATGAGLSGPGQTLVSAFVPDPQQGPGTLGGAGFDEGALPVVLHVTDAVFHAPGEGSLGRDCFDGYLDYGLAGAPGVPTAHTRAECVSALGTFGLRVVGLISREYPVDTACSPYDDLVRLALETGAAVPPEAFGGACGPGLCCTGLDGAGRVPAQGGLCPLVFEIRNDGSGLGAQTTNAILALARYGRLDVSRQVVGALHGEQGEPLPAGNTTADFLEEVAALDANPPAGMTPPEIQDRDQDGVDDTFAQTTPGTEVRFQVTAYNDFVAPTSEVQLFVARIQVLGDEVTVLDERNVYIVVPPEIPVVPVN